MGLGQNIANKRKELKLSQEYIAEQLGVSRQAVSKWETGRSEPTAKNLVELARIFNVSVSELVEPEKQPESIETPERKRSKRSWEIFAVSAYSGAAIMSTFKTNDPGFVIYASILILIAAIFMAVNIARLPSDIRFNMAIKELCYCVVIYCVITFLEPVIGNVFASVLVLICCVLYAKYIRFKEPT